MIGASQSPRRQRLERRGDRERDEPRPPPASASHLICWRSRPVRAAEANHQRRRRADKSDAISKSSESRIALNTSTGGARRRRTGSRPRDSPRTPRACKAIATKRAAIHRRAAHQMRPVASAARAGCPSGNSSRRNVAGSSDARDPGHSSSSQAIGSPGHRAALAGSTPVVRRRTRRNRARLQRQGRLRRRSIRSRFLAGARRRARRRLRSTNGERPDEVAEPGSRSSARLIRSGSQELEDRARARWRRR